jgi:hypothetical protein
MLMDTQWENESVVVHTCPPVDVVFPRESARAMHA